MAVVVPPNVIAASARKTRLVHERKLIRAGTVGAAVIVGLTVGFCVGVTVGVGVGATYV